MLDAGATPKRNAADEILWETVGLLAVFEPYPQARNWKHSGPKSPENDPRKDENDEILIPGKSHHFHRKRFGGPAKKQTPATFCE